ncbi:MAG: serine kinase [Candidatus Aminicenantes bacterium]|nr:serine kinase [Candidatus Aminicenantes bacterium]
MKLKEIIEKLQLRVITAQGGFETEVTGGYTSDLLSDVMANSQKGNIWITLQTHQNIIAVAKLKELSGIVLVKGREPDEETTNKAEEEKIPLLSSKESAFSITGKLYKLISEKKIDA